MTNIWDVVTQATPLEVSRIEKQRDQAIRHLRWCLSNPYLSGDSPAQRWLDKYDKERREDGER